MNKTVDLLHGPIFPSLSKLALPIMATSFVQMAYNMTDMYWIGGLGSGAVAAVGTAGMFTWMSNGVSTMMKMGGQVRTGFSIGAGNSDDALSYARNTLQITILAGIIIGLIAILFAPALIGFFHLNNPDTIAQAEVYLRITMGLMIFSFINQVMTGLTTAMGNSQISFKAASSGLILNVILDPLLIYGVGPFPNMGVIGAAVATVFAQAIVTLIFVIYAMKEPTLLSHIKLFEKPNFSYIKGVLKIGFPAGIQSMLFSGISMILTRLVTTFGDGAVAVQRLGSQIEGISWVTAEGFGVAVNSFLAQNLGAQNRKRIVKGYYISLAVSFIWGLLCTLALVLFPEQLFGLFLDEKALLPMGVSYLVILGYSQLFMCVEMTTAGAFAGLGKTIPPSVISILFTASRIPFAYFLASTSLGLDGIWWSVSISSMFKGVILCAMFMFYLHRKLKIADK